jgi:pimeloyl-ACP methyl ester carboxylesterase
MSTVASSPKRVERGTMGRIPYAAVGVGAPLVVLAGVSPGTGVESGTLVRTVLAPVRHLASRRRLYALNRWADLPEGMTMSDLAAEHAAAFRDHFDEPVDLVGISTGGSIAQQVAAEHPDVVRRLVLISTGCRLGDQARQEQADVAALLREDKVREAGALLAMDVLAWAGPLGRATGWAVAPQILGGRRARADLATTLEAEDAFDLAGCATSIAAPTLIIGGARDRFYDRELFRETAALIPDSNLLMVPRRGHITVASDRRTRAHITGFLQAP